MSQNGQTWGDKRFAFAKTFAFSILSINGCTVLTFVLGDDVQRLASGLVSRRNDEEDGDAQTDALLLYLLAVGQVGGGTHHNHDLENVSVPRTKMKKALMLGLPPGLGLQILARVPYISTRCHTKT